jgi:hypothetical protein
MKVLKKKGMKTITYRTYHNMLTTISRAVILKIE